MPPVSNATVFPQVRPGSQDRLVVREHGKVRQFALVRDRPQVIGRDPEADLVFPDETVSRKHAVVRHEDGKYFVTDQGSANGTWLNRVRLPAETPFRLRSGDILRVGEFVLRVVYAGDELPEGDDENTEDVGEPVPFDTKAAVAAICGLGTTKLRRPEGEAAAETERAKHEDTTQILAPMDTSARLIVALQRGHRAFVVGRRRVTIGRVEHCEICVPHPTVSATHAEVIFTEQGFRLNDLGSTNGTWLGEERVQTLVLPNGTAFRIGHTWCLFQVPVERGTPAVDSPLDPASERRFAEWLGRSNRAPQQAVQSALDHPRKRGQTLGEVLLFRGVITAEAYAAALRAYTA